ncbi:hypothetical protein CAEBREN_10555 [Caenorhabditis brenneri]|uniref:Uncharacterized protein n=1 Tax=Caenorhabditis brenneri TaxID=135651 RepID=G0NJA8_CAEBE|nr:hypothetical protein CAEBREN_10555 [Caenorhabditis brenneri]
MIIPPLKALATKKASYYIEYGYLTLSYRLPEDASNQLFDVHGSHLSNIDPTKLEVTRAKLDGCSQRDYENLTNVHLEFLSIGNSYTSDLTNWLNEKKLKEGKTFIDCLIDCMAPSRQSLKSFRSDIKESYDVNWLSKILDYFVNLHRLDFSVDNCSRPRQFPQLMKTYPKVDCLNISNTAISSLNGISKFPNLNVLVMQNLHFKTADDIAELFSLQHLRYLDVSHEFVPDKQTQDQLYDDVVRAPNTLLALQLIQDKRSFPRLEEIDCSNIAMDTNTLNTFLKLNPTVKKIALLNTQVGRLTWDKVEVVSTKDLESSLEAMEWYRKNDQNKFTTVILRAIAEHLKKKLDFEANEVALRKCLDVLLDIVEGCSDYCSRGGDNTCVVESVILICELYLQHLSTKKIQQVVSVMMNNRKTDFLAYTILANPYIVKTPGLDVRWLYQKVLNFFAHQIQKVTPHTRDMVRALKNVHDLTTREIRNQTKGKIRCIPVLYDVLDTMVTSKDFDLEEELPFCQFLAKLTEKMVSSLDVALHWHLAMLIIEWMKRCPYPEIKLLFLNAFQFVIYRLKKEDIPELAERVDLKAIMSCLLGNLRTPDSITGEDLEWELAFSAIHALAYLYQPEKSGDFTRQLREVAEHNKDCPFHLPRIEINQETGARTFFTSDEKQLESWIDAIAPAIRLLKDDLTRFNKNKYEPRQQKVTERISIRFEYLDDPAIDAWHTIVVFG